MAAPLPFALPAAARRHSAVSAGLFIGVREFEDPELPQVQFAVDDAVDLAHLFSLELGLIDPVKTVVLLAGEPQKPESRQRLAALEAAGSARGLPSSYWIFHFIYGLGQQTAEQGLFVASFATHGLTDQGRALLAVSGTLRRRAIHTGLPLDLVLDDLSKSRAARRLLIMDACRRSFDKSTREGEDWRGPIGEAFSAALRQAQGCAILAGASQGGYSYDDFDRQNGVFTGALIDGLRGGAEGDSEALIRLDGLASYAQNQVRKWVLSNRPSHAEISLGISATYDPDTMRQMPLSLDSRKRLSRLAAELNVGLKQLLRHIEIDDPLYRRVVEYLNPELSGGTPLELLREISDFDGSARHRRSLVALLDELSPLSQPPPTTKLETSRGPLGSGGGSKHKASPFVATGADSFGSWGLIQVGRAVQKMRWIEPGTFWMGGLNSDAKLSAVETIVPRHRVTLTEGFWLADTPCTQALWKEIANRNPSAFKSDDRPVENLSWKRAQTFLEGLQAKISGCQLWLPTEAQWEYACRAGSEADTYIGDVPILGERNAPLLDAISWYAGNSGVGYDLEIGVDSQPWKEKQYQHVKAGTRAVGQKAPNAWGLYDMLGNVREWCRDAFEFRVDPPIPHDRVDPVEERGRFRITRGGSWMDEARGLLIPVRNLAQPGTAIFLNGFRILLK